MFKLFYNRAFFLQKLVRVVWTPMPEIPQVNAAHFPSGTMVKSIIPALLTDTQRNGVQQLTITQKTRNGDSVLTR